MNSNPDISAARGPVFLYDGECGFCNRTVRWLLRSDRHGRLRFAALQSPVAVALLQTHGLDPTELSTAVFVPDWERRTENPVSVRSRAFIRALWVCGGWARIVAAGLALIPRPLADAGYHAIAARRRQISAALAACPTPSVAWRKRFIA